MSKSGIPIVSDVAKAVGQGVKRLMPKMPDVPAPAPLPQRADVAAAAPKPATEQFATREATAQRQIAAGVQQSENEYDLLGTKAKKRDARRVLGGEFGGF